MKTIPHISYETAKALKAFCPELSEPMGGDYWGNSGIGKYAPSDGLPPAYRLEDLLTREFCCNMSKAMGVYYYPTDVCKILASEYFYGELPAVEAELMRMMEGR